MENKMKFIEWTEKLSVHVKKIDKQHQKLFDIINSAHESIVIKQNRKKLERALNDLIEFVRVHFSTEENYFKKCNYEYAEGHIHEHVKYIKKTIEFKIRFDNQEDISEELLVFLKKWWLNHVKIYDQKYADNFKRCGLK